MLAQTTFLGSRAIAGSLIQNDFTNVLDASGISLASVLEKNGYTDDVADDISIPPGKLKAYVEVHTEQGPRLRKIGSPLGVVAEIAGQTFLKVCIWPLWHCLQGSITYCHHLRKQMN